MKSGKRELNFSKKKGHNKKSKSDSDHETDDKKPTEDPRSRYNYKFSKPRPTHFLSLRIDSPHIVNGVKQIQDDIVASYPQLQPYVTPAIKSHLTLFILNLPNPDSIEKAKKTLASCQEIFSQHYSDRPCTANLGKLGHFRDQVLFVGLDESEHTKKLQEFVYSMYLPFKEAGLTCEEMKKPWTPHCTVMKLSKGNQRHKSKGNNKTSEKNNANLNNNDASENNTEKEEILEISTIEAQNTKQSFAKVHKIDRASYEKHKEIQFGEHIFAGVELSAMSAVDPDGYYQCLHRELFAIGPPFSTNISSSSSPTISSTISSTTVSSPPTTSP